ncbi:ABC transporter permease [Nocardioides albus]|uniref:Peptide/nickel transport system permease protein n=1 Tax=Nocardioides albus TaxID=1841 RepID=A0A7W5A3V6_9ACTN|nr:ABC transporter permease [Nocardioides albus]MBB3088995.1 peptide/nickel transport system permease protein [Nocardioides albus]GGU14933.1 glutathione ABC transporter permease GsiD [Nocardioides albus]
MTAIIVAADSFVGPSRERFSSGRAPVVASYVILAIVLAVVVSADLIAPYDPNKQDLDAILLGPSAAHPFGTDDLGRDLVSRMIYGTRVSVLAAGQAVAIAVLIGVPLGLAAGYVGKAADLVIMRVVDAVMSFPAIVLAIGITATLGPDITTAMTAVGVVMAPTIIRLMRAQTMSVKGATFVEAARSFGARGVRRLILPHILPNVIQPVLVQIAILMGFALIAEASLSFLQLGVQPPTASWGSVLSRAYTFFDQTPMQIFIPGIAIALTVFALNIIGDDVQRRLDPKRKGR